MSGPVTYLLELEVKPGELDTVQALMAEMVDATRRGEPGALIYEWSLGDDGERLHILERYADATATRAHLDAFQTHYARRFYGSLKPRRLTVYGTPDAELREVLAAARAVFMAPIGGFAR